MLRGSSIASPHSHSMECTRSRPHLERVRWRQLSAEERRCRYPYGRLSARRRLRSPSGGKGMPSPRVNQVGTTAGGAGDRLICLGPIIKAGILGPALNAKSQRWALVEKDDCHRIVPHLCGALELHGFHVRTGSAEENLKVRQIPEMRNRAHVPHHGTALRTGQGLGSTLFHTGCYEGPAQADTPGIYVGMLVLPDRCATATAAARRGKSG